MCTHTRTHARTHARTRRPGPAAGGGKAWTWAEVPCVAHFPGTLRPGSGASKEDMAATIQWLQMTPQQAKCYIEVGT